MIAEICETTLSLAVLKHVSPEGPQKNPTSPPSTLSRHAAPRSDPRQGRSRRPRRLRQITLRTTLCRIRRCRIRERVSIPPLSCTLRGVNVPYAHSRIGGDLQLDGPRGPPADPSVLGACHEHAVLPAAGRRRQVFVSREDGATRPPSTPDGVAREAGDAGSGFCARQPICRERVAC